MDFWIKHDLKTNTSPDRTRNLARCRSFQTLVNFHKLTKKRSLTVSQKTKHPPIFRMSGGGFLLKSDLKKKGYGLPKNLI